MRIAVEWIDTLLAALDHAGIGLSITRDGPDGLMWLHRNESMRRILGRTDDELRTMPVMDVIAPSVRARMEEIRRGILTGEPPPMMFDSEIIRGDGVRVPVEVGVAAQVEGEHAVTLVVLRDVTDQRRMQSRLLEADRLSTVGALCAGLAHEIYNPLTSVLLHLGGLRKGLERWVPDPAARVHLAGVIDTIEAGAERIGRTVRELAVFADPKGPPSGPANLRSIVEGAARAVAPVVESRARFQVGVVPVPPVDADPPRLGQAVMNLIVEAALSFDRADRLQNLVEVSLRAEPSWVIVEVSDNGCSVDEDRAGRAFEPFFAARGAASSGIGLAVARTIVTSLGGTASLAPRAGGGAIATIRLPTCATAG